MKHKLLITSLILCILSTPISADTSLLFNVDINYAEQMIMAATNGDIEAGKEAERLRNLKKEYFGIADFLTFDDLLLLARIVDTEAGSEWLSEEHRQLVASVVINRVNSPEFPNTLEEVIYQKDQYSAVGTKGFENLVPSEWSVRSAFSVLINGSIAPPDVVFQAGFTQGSGIYKEISDKTLGATTYFCYSTYPEKYT